jgi:hypothetical protein
MTWFKLHSDFRNDPKIKRLPIAERYAFIILLCLANESETRGTITGLDDDDIAFELEMQVEDWKTLRSKFKIKGFIDFAQEQILIRNWKEKFSSPIRFHSRRITNWESLRLEVFQRDNYSCVYCGKSEDVMHCDHVHPKSKGGTDDLDNLVTACAFCNTSKGTKSLEEWRKNK